MRKLAIFILIVANTLAANAQLKLNGTLGTYTHNNVGNRYTNLNWEVSYKFEKRTDGIYLTYYNQKITIAQNSLYATAEKNYSKSELGLSVWPESYSPASLNVSVNCRLPNGKVELSGFACSTSDPYTPYERRIFATTLNGQEVSLSAFTLSVTKASYNPQSVQELDNIINQRKSQNMTSESTGALNTSAQNPLSTTPITTTRTTTQETQRQAYEQAQAAKAARAELTAQVVTQAAGVVGGLLDDWNAASERKRAKQLAANEERKSVEAGEALKRYRAIFVDKYLPLMDKANKGDEDARMTLYFASASLFCKELVPLSEQWLEEALANNNTDALLEKATLVFSEKAIPYLEKAANLGSADALLSLAMHYSHLKYFNPQNESLDKISFDYFIKAAEIGSPNAMHNLGLIYQYGHNTDIKLSRKYWKYNVVMDEKIALEWFLKANKVTNYKESLYSRSRDAVFGYSSISCPYLETSQYAYYKILNLYKKGKVVKDKAKAEEMEAKNQNITPKQKSKEQLEFEKSNEKFWNRDM